MTATRRTSTTLRTFPAVHCIRSITIAFPVRFLLTSRGVRSLSLPSHRRRSPVLPCSAAADRGAANRGVRRETASRSRSSRKQRLKHSSSLVRRLDRPSAAATTRDLKTGAPAAAAALRAAPR